MDSQQQFCMRAAGIDLANVPHQRAMDRGGVLNELIDEHDPFGLLATGHIPFS
ncbi:hypothetical protein [Mesorhizobium sp. ZC-5]|uniref:hypothetical protein n=1 Tax=Mesorhizobium sp. ZC-5 TaxID=2986066 RepID=UPI0021E732D5|nr:hypothetical protein [Mesorhizobium sp. ZC-5]MCV3239684.1 hypothetical protein [Mesorhizobium sp. ZC-5]